MSQAMTEPRKKAKSLKLPDVSLADIPAMLEFHDALIDIAGKSIKSLRAGCPRDKRHLIKANVDYWSTVIKGIRWAKLMLNHQVKRRTPKEAEDATPTTPGG